MKNTNDAVEEIHDGIPVTEYILWEGSTSLRHPMIVVKFINIKSNSYMLSRLTCPVTPLTKNRIKP